jgi:hypothetical protein
MTNKEHFLELIRSNIEKYEFHITTVQSSTVPRFAYTIGLKERFNLELIFSGGIYFLYDDLSLIFHSIVKEIKKEKSAIGDKIHIDNLGTFSLSKVHPSWSSLMLLGVFDYYKISDINAFQITPAIDHYTLDIPDMSKELDASAAPVWQWLAHEWNLSVPENSTVVTNINALLGETVTEVARWESDEWEMFAGAGPDVDERDMRVVPLGTMLGIDGSLFPSVHVEIGKALWRESKDSAWQNWGE